MDSSCRTCSRHDEFRGVPIESLSERHQEPIYLMLIYCTQLQISTTDTLPQQICPNCMVMLDRAFTFWQQCRFSDANFRWGPPAVVEPEIPEAAPSPLPTAEVAPAPPPAETITQQFWCCFRKCPAVRPSLEEMEAHAKEVHSPKRIWCEKRRTPAHAYVCTICRAGFETLGNLEYHRTIQLGIRKKKGLDSKTDGSNQGIEQSIKVVLDRIIYDAKDKFEAKARTMKEDFLIYLRKRDYEVVCSTKDTRRIFMSKVNAFAQKICQKAIRLIQICNSCRYETNFSREMQRHIEKEHSQNATCSYAVQTYDLSITVYKCIQCSYETILKNRLMRHQITLNHEGIEISKPPPQSDDLITIKNEPMPFSEDEDESQDVLQDEHESQEVFERTEEPGEKLDCTHCGMILRSDEDKQRHLIYECKILNDKTARYTCEHCKVVSTKTVKGLRKHIRKECAVLKGKPRGSHKFTPKTCPKCGRTFNTNEGVVRHSIFCSMDQSSQALSCPKCQRVFSKKFYLERHLNLNSCVKSLNQCKHCRATLPDQLALKRHRKVGCPALLNPESFGLKASCTCPRCGKACANKLALKRHEFLDSCRDEQSLTATAGKFPCPHCRMQLANTNVLRRHLKQTCLVLLHRQAEQERKEAELQVEDSEEMFWTE